jgi:hypothetical protein
MAFKDYLDKVGLEDNGNRTTLGMSGVGRAHDVRKYLEDLVKNDKVCGIGGCYLMIDVMLLSCCLGACLQQYRLREHGSDGI